MLNVITSKEGFSFPHDPARRGYHVVYQPHEVNRCPGCGRSHWIVGRLLAECGFCATALPLADGGMNGAGLIRRNWRAIDQEVLAA